MFTRSNGIRALSTMVSFCLALSAFGIPKSSEMLLENRRQSYFVIKKIAQEDLNKTFQSTLAMELVHKDDREYRMKPDFNLCGENDSFTSSSFDKYSDSDLMFLLTTLAIDVARWQKGLQDAGYPESVFGPHLDNFEEHVISRIEKLSDSEIKIIKKSSDDALKKATEDKPDYYGPFQESYREEAELLASRLNDYRNRTKSKIPEVIVTENECGAGGLIVTISTNPRGGIIWVIPMFFYKLCKAQNLNVNDPNSCDRWREIHDGFHAEISGDYRYKVRWHDGSIREGTLPFGNVEGEKKLVISKPN